MKISFDFDGTLEYAEVQDLAKELIADGHDVCILTTRYSDPESYDWAKLDPEQAKTVHDTLYQIASELGITKIYFTEYQWKTGFVDVLKIDIHIDDNYENEVAVINHKNKTKAIEYHFGQIRRVRKQVYSIIDNS